MSDIPWVLAIGDSASPDDMVRALREADAHFETEAGLLTDLSHECGLDWAITGLEHSRRVRALMPWAPFEDGDVDVRDALIDEIEHVDFFFEGDQASWTRRASSYESARAFTFWEIMSSADMVILFYSGRASDFLRRMARCAFIRRRAVVWGYDTLTGARAVWTPDTMKEPLERPR